MSDIETRIHSFDDGRLVVESRQDVEPILESVKALNSAGAGRGDDMHHVASFPAVVVEQYMRLHGVTLRDMMLDPKHFERMLSDRDLSGFRIKPIDSGFHFISAPEPSGDEGR